GADPQQRRLPGAVRTGDHEEAAARQRKIDSAEDALFPVALAETAGREHVSRIGRFRDLPPPYASLAQTRPPVGPDAHGNELDHPRPGGEPCQGSDSRCWGFSWPRLSPPPARQRRAEELRPSRRSAQRSTPRPSRSVS